MIYNDVNFDGSHYSGSDFELWCNFSDTATNLYLAERLLVLVHPAHGKNIEITVENAGVTASYTPDANGYVIIDLTDIARTYESIGPITMIKEADGTDDYEILANYSNVRLIDPAKALRPYFPEQQSDAILAPPQKLLAPLGGLSLLCELQHPSEDDWYFIDKDTLRSIFITSDSFAVPATSPNFYIYTDSFSGRDYNRQLVQPVCGWMYAAVRWRSFTGVTRLHMFEVVKKEFGTSEKVALLRPDGVPITSKGRTDKMTLRIDGLCAYDVWYYGDVITSGLVEVSLDGVTWQRVDVGTSSVQVPDGDAINGKVEIQLTYKQYDAVTL